VFGCVVATSVRRPGSFPGGSAVDLTSQVSDTSTLGVNMAEYVLGSSPHDSRLHSASHRYVSKCTDMIDNVFVYGIDNV